jgi:hypothetical protein
VISILKYTWRSNYILLELFLLFLKDKKTIIIENH